MGLMETYEQPFKGIVTTNEWNVLPDGRQYNTVQGHMSVLTDKDVGKDFRSAERWCLIVWKDKSMKEMAIMIPGCRVQSIGVLAGLKNVKMPVNAAGTSNMIVLL